MKELGPIFPVIKNYRGKILKQVSLTSGKDAPYPHLFLNPPTGEKLECFLHKIVGLAFLKNNDFEHKYLIDHLDDNIFNYMPHNLEWVTNSENQKRRRLRGR